MTAIRVELQLADGSFTSGMLRAGQSVEGFRRALMAAHPQLARLEANGVNVVRSMTQMDASTKGFLGTLRDVTLVTGLISLGISKMTSAANGWAGEIVRVNAEMERLNYQMRAMSTAADPIKDAADNVKYLREQATQMPFSLKTITSGFVKLKATGTDPTNGSLKAIADGIAAFGGSDESFNRTILGITQAAGKGVLQMEELRQQIGESMPVAMQLLARSMGLTVGQLAKEIQTGTVAARPALEMLYKELDRAYGGTAQRMMQTFSGQVTQLYTNLQNLATSEGGRGFFDQVKNQLRDINQFLSGDMAQRIAVSLGQGLSSVVEALRTSVETVWEFRDELSRLAVVAAGGVGFLALARGASSLTTAVQTSALAFRMMRVNMAESFATMALGATGFRQLGTVMTGTQLIASGLGGALKAATVGLVGMAPLLVTIGMAAWAASEYFGLLSDKVNDAYENLKKYGAETRKDAEDAIDAKRKQLEDRLAAMQKAATMASPGAWDEQIAQTIREIEELNKIAPKLQEDATKREASRALDNFRTQVSELTDEKQRLYRQEQAERDQQYDKELGAAGNNERRKFELQQKYQADTLDAQKKLSQGIIEIYDEQRQTLESQLEKANDADKASLRERLSFLNDLRISEFNRLKELDSAKFGAPKTSAGGNDAKAIERGQSALDNLKRDIAGLQANLEGASGAVAEMNEKIASGDYGVVKQTGDEVDILHQKLLAAAEAKEELDKVMKSNQKADNDINRIREQLAENWAELEERRLGRTLNPADKMRLKLNRDDDAGYFGLGSVEKIKRDLGDVVSRMNVQGETANRIGEVMRENAFGEQTVQHINSVGSAIDALTSKINGIGTAIGNLDFSRLGQGLTGGLMGFGGSAPTITSFSGSMLELIAKGESGGNYNATLDNGRWTGGEQNLVGMTLNQVRELQRQMLANPANRAKYGNGLGSSALGKYQIVGKTLQGLMEEMGLSGNELFDEKMQDAMAMRLLNRRLASGQGIEGLRNEWTSLKNVSPEVIQNALNGMNNGPTREAAASMSLPSTAATAQAPVFQPTVLDAQIEKTRTLDSDLGDLSKQWDEWVRETNDQDLADWMTKTAKETEALGEDAEKAGTRVSQLRKAIVAGEFGEDADSKNPMAERYEEAFRRAEEFDRKSKEVAENTKVQGQIERDQKKLEEDRLEINRRLAEAQKQLKDPNYKADSNALQELTTRMERYVEQVKQLYKGRENSEEGKNAILQAERDKQSAIASLRNLEATESQVAFQKQTTDLRNSLLTQTQARQQAMQQELAQVDAWLEEQRRAGAEEVEIVRMAEEQKALIRQKYAEASSPMQKQFQEWGDLQTNLANASAKWMDSLAGGITDLIMGTGDLRSVIQGILKDIVNMGVKYMMSKMFDKSGSAGASAKGGKSGGGGKKAATTIATGGKGGIGKFGTAHTGGLIGSSSLVPKMASASIFNNAAKFHTGGIVDGLLPSEVPIIAKKGEGVFTPEQMEAMGGFQQAQQFNINSPITVNGSSGTPEQNSDLAKKMAREYEVSVRSVVADEIRKQSKVGNFLNQRSR